MGDDDVSKLLESLSDEQRTELIQKILNSNVKSDDPPASQEEQKSPEQKREDGLFVMNKGSGQVNKIPVTEGKRFNKFRDDGTEHQDENNQTPEAPIGNLCSVFIYYLLVVYGVPVGIPFIRTTSTLALFKVIPVSLSLSPLPSPDC